MVLDIGASGAERIADFAVVHLSEVGKKDDLSFCPGEGHERIVYALVAHNEMQTVFHDIPFELEIPVCRDELVQLFRRHLSEELFAFQFAFTLVVCVPCLISEDYLAVNMTTMPCCSAKRIVSL